MQSQTKDRDTALCSWCGREVNVNAGSFAVAAEEVLCDGCYLSALAPDHRIQVMETFD
jgi:NMD protein affecting ribosome stability and mRNA decay